MIDNNYKYSELTSKIIACALIVHTALGNGFREVIYQRALAMEMEEQGLAFSQEHNMPVFYKQVKIGMRRVDFLVEKVIAVELKARTSLEDAHYAQAFNYLKCYDLEVGLLINFGDKSLVFKRLQNKIHKQANQGNPLL